MTTSLHIVRNALLCGFRLIELTAELTILGALRMLFVKHGKRRATASLEGRQSVGTMTVGIQAARQSCTRRMDEAPRLLTCDRVARRTRPPLGWYAHGKPAVRKVLRRNACWRLCIPETQIRT
jgi:hypothetical protein